MSREIKYTKRLLAIVITVCALVMEQTLRIE
jgi:hypothetical protein